MTDTNLLDIRERYVLENRDLQREIARLRGSLEAIYQMRDPWKMRYEADSALGTFRLGPPVPPTAGPTHD